jgi:hypothetical protein
MQSRKRKGGLLCADEQGFVRIVDSGGRLRYERWPEQAEVLGLVDILKTDAVEAEFLTGESDIHRAARALAADGPAEIVLTHRDGLLVLADDRFHEAGFHPETSDKAVEEKLGHAYQKVQELEDDATVPRAAYAGNHSLAEGRTGIIGGLAYIGAVGAAGAVVASGGTLAAVIAAAAIAGGGGGLLGGWAAGFLGRDRVKQIQNQLDHGGLLLWVHVRDATQEERAVDVLKRNGAEDVHVHDIPASEDPDANPLSGLQIDPFLPGARF